MLQQRQRAATLTACAVLGLLLSAGAAAQAPALPDVVGFRPGTPLQEAYKQLQSYEIRGQVRVGQLQIPELGDKPFPHTLQLSEAGPTSPEVVQLDVTLPPSKQVVWRVSRVLQSIAADKAMAKSTVLGALRDKYGKEFSFTPSANSFYWFFDAQGQRAAETGGVSYKNCVAALGGEFQPEFADDVNMLTRNPYTDPQFNALPATHRACRSLLVVIAHIFPFPGTEMVYGLRVSAAHAGLATQARQATYDAIVGVQGRQRNEELGKAQQRKPKL